MGVLAVEELMMREPNLLLPGRRPVGRVRLRDKRVVNCMVGGITLDLATNLSPTVNTVSTIVGATGRMWYRASGSTEYLNFERSASLNNQELTALFVGLSPSDTNSAVAFGYGVGSGASANALHVARRYSSSQLGCQIFTTSNSYAVFTSGAYAQRPVVLVLRWRTGEKAQCWILDIVGGGTTFIESSTTVPGTLLSGGAFRIMPYDNNLSFSGGVALGAILMEALPAAECIALLRDPYRILEPA